MLSICVCVCVCEYVTVTVSSVSAYVSVSVSVSVSMPVYVSLCIGTVRVHLCLVNNLYIVVSSKREISRISAS